VKSAEAGSARLRGHRCVCGAPSCCACALLLGCPFDDQAVRREGMNHRNMARIDEAFQPAGEAMAAGMRYNSERVLQGSRQFRRSYAGAGHRPGA
jgi:hypothetical protein